MRLQLDLLPYINPLLELHHQIGQQPDNLCGPYWIALLLGAYGGLSVTAIEVAIAASTVLPSVGSPRDWLPPQANSQLGPGYDTIPTLPDIEQCGTSITGLVQATKQLSQSRFCLLPLKTINWLEGLAIVWDLCQTRAEWQVVPLLNPHTSYLWGSRLTPMALSSYLQTGKISPPPPDWSVGHFSLLTGQLQGNDHSLYAVLDTYPAFGWDGLHLQPPQALAQALHRPQQKTNGGIALFFATERRTEIEHLVVNAGLETAVWDNGSPDFVPSDTAFSNGCRDTVRYSSHQLR